jgi:Tol biopolymer transport system component
MFSRTPPSLGWFSRPALIGPLDLMLTVLFGLLPITATVHAAEASDPPGVSRISFSSRMSVGNFDIYLVNPDGSDVTRVTHAASDEDNAAISPNGTQIIYESNRFSYAQLFVINADGSGEHRLIPTNFYGQDGAWYLDGRRIAFTHLDASQTIGSIWVVNTNGTSLTQLSPDGASDMHPDWKPDGSAILFSSDISGHIELFLMNANGTGRHRFTDSSGNKRDACWSPDGTRIAYTVYFAPPASSIHVMNADGSGDTALTDTTYSNGRPAWSPDGSEIAFHSTRDGTYQIYRIQVSGTGLERVTFDGSTPGDWCGNWRIVNDPAGIDDPSGSDTGQIDLDVPSPVRGRAAIRFETDRGTPVSLAIFDGSGRLVRRLLDQRLTAGPHSVVWDGRDDQGAGAATGVYLLRLISGEAGGTARLIYVR